MHFESINEDSDAYKNCIVPRQRNFRIDDFEFRADWIDLNECLPVNSFYLTQVIDSNMILLAAKHAYP